ncbi:MAG: hypothetical protein PUP46_02040 [Endozoicomonas sp. (ex Botrylloides leachii)]|nr:hypothetical protein [Endozoicomonas sp. (ex Botrylloides leachii)]
MRGLAELAMRGPKPAVVLSVIFACVPVIFWLSAAIVSLVILRRGIDHGLKVLAWAILPGIAWAATGQYSVLMGLLATVSMACVLRLTVSWEKTLLTLVPLGGLMALVFSQLATGQVDQLAAVVMKFITSFMKQTGKSPEELSTSLQPLVHYGVIGLMAWFNMLSCIIGLALARSWQSWLYNPGGFRQEFHAIRLPAISCFILLAITLVSFAVSPFMVALVPLASLPLFVAGLSLLHGLVSIGKHGSLWLIIFYVMVLFFTQIAYPAIILTACFDSLFDFRKRAQSKTS